LFFPVCMYVKILHFFFLCIFRSLPGLNLTHLSFSWLTFGSSHFYWNFSKGPIQAVLGGPFEYRKFQFFNFENKEKNGESLDSGKFCYASSLQNFWTSLDLPALGTWNLEGSHSRTFSYTKWSKHSFVGPKERDPKSCCSLFFHPSGLSFLSPSLALLLPSFLPSFLRCYFFSFLQPSSARQSSQMEWNTKSVLMLVCVCLCVCVGPIDLLPNLRKQFRLLGKLRSAGWWRCRAASNFVCCVVDV
jgi:hypothetical protein